MCFSCDLDPFDWNNDPDDPFDFHVIRSPKYPFVRITQLKKKRNEKTRQQYKKRTLQLATRETTSLITHKVTQLATRETTPLATHEIIQLATHEAIQLVIQEVIQKVTPSSPPTPLAPLPQCIQPNTQPIAQQTQPSKNTTENTVKNTAKHTTKNTIKKSNINRITNTQTTDLLSTMSHSIIKPFCGKTPLHAGLNNAPLLIGQRALLLTFQLAFQLASLPGYIPYAEEMQATGQG